MYKEIPSKERLDELFSYSSKTGLLKRKNTTASNAKKGTIAGYITNLGYWVVHVDGIQYLTHRIIWKMKYGSLDVNLQVDHIDGDTKNNRIKNLRTITALENQRNRRLSKTSTSGQTGVGWIKRLKKWNARINVEGKSIHLGIFKNLVEAIEARKNAEIEYGFHPNHGRKLTKTK